MLKTKINKLEHYLLKKVGKAIYDYKLINDNDRILIGVSGGKDSLTLLRLLLLKRTYLPIKYTVIAAHIDFGLFQQNGIQLDDYFKKNQVDYHIEKIELPAKNNDKLSNCFWCSWNRRKILFNLAKRYNCNKVALGHHFDDIVETFLMNLFFHGEISSMPPKLSMFSGELEIIRPLIYIPEELIREYAICMKLPFVEYICPNYDNSQRRFIENLLSELEKKCDYLKKNIFRSMKRIKQEYLI
jgi:tRNA(Ile)-lysidine synthetase-like protein